MNDLLRILAIGKSGLSVERLRLEVAARNLANLHAIDPASRTPYVPLRVVATAPITAFDALSGALSSVRGLQGVTQVEVVSQPAVTRLASDPGSPQSNEQGLVARSSVNPLDEMLTVMTATRAYEANVRVLNAAKAMAAKALEIGDARA